MKASSHLKKNIPFRSRTIENKRIEKTTNQKRMSAPSTHPLLQNDTASSCDKIYARTVTLRLLEMWIWIWGGARWILFGGGLGNSSCVRTSSKGVSLGFSKR